MYRGFYINLRSNTQRRAALEHHLQELGIADLYERVEAVVGRDVAHEYATTLDAGNLGLWLTHIGIVRDHRASDTDLHIIEDDAIFAKDARRDFELILRAADANLGDWDIIFTEIVLLPDARAFDVFSQKIDEFQKSGLMTLCSLGQLSFGCTSSIFIRKQSIEKYLSLIEGGWAAGLPIDLFIRQLIRRGQLKAYVTLPFLTSLSSHALQSDIRAKLDKSRAVMNVYSRSFFKDADYNALRTEMNSLVQNLRLRPLSEIYLNALAFQLSDQYEKF